MANKSFSILVPYKGSMVIATATEVENPVQMYYQVSFPDGFNSLFHTYEGDRGWAEAELDVTQLARDIGPIIDMYRHQKYFEPLIIAVNETNYAIQPFTEDEGKTIQYEVYKMTGEHLMNIFLDKGDEWNYEEISFDDNLKCKSLVKDIGAAVMDRLQNASVKQL